MLLSVIVYSIAGAMSITGIALYFKSNEIFQYVDKIIGE